MAAPMNGDEAPHSALYLTDERDAWWNEDFLALLAARIGWSGLDASRAIRDVLDVGCGKGHWTRTLARLVPPGARVVGVDREPQWIDDANARVADDGVSQPHGFSVADATALPFPDASFDVVTCQTLLIHVADVGVVLAEMRRVLRPGGRVVALEPNNLGESFARLVGDPRFDLDDALAFVKLGAVCEKGKYVLGLGYNSIGERMSAQLVQAGFVDVRAWNNDRVTTTVTPGDRAHFDDENLVWSKAETRRYFDAALAAGTAVGIDPATVDDFETLWARARRTWARYLEDPTIATNGCLFYVVTGTRPTP